MTEIKLPPLPEPENGHLDEMFHVTHYSFSKRQVIAHGYECRRAALEDAAKVCDEQVNEPECPERAAYCAEAIRSLK